MLRTFARATLACHSARSLVRGENNNLLIRIEFTVHRKIGDLIVGDLGERKELLHGDQHIRVANGHGRGFSGDIRARVASFIPIVPAEFDGVLVFCIAYLDGDFLLLVINQQLHVRGTAKRLNGPFGEAHG